MNAGDPRDPFGLVGQVLDGQFRVDALVGEGGFSAVYRGHHQGLNEPIAIKCLKLPAALGTSLVDTFVQRFRDESRILYRLSQGNLNVVRSIAAGTTQAPATGALVPYMVLEWLEGRSLQNDFTVRRTLGEKGRSIEEVLKIFDSAADGLAHAHSQGVMHRDLNPGNLFLANTQHGTKMKVLDFGVAKLMHDGPLNLGPRAQTVGHIKIFAPAYGAPEQFDDRIGAVGPASDVYSFALILMEALRDKNVVEGTHLGEFAQTTTNPENRPTPRSLGIDVPDEVEQAFARATTLDPAQRWPSAGDFWKSLTIAQKFATERKYENAARETPPLAMGGPPAPAKTPMARTMPLGATTPGLPRPAPGAPRPRTPTTIGIPAPATFPRPGTGPAAIAPPGAPAAPALAAPAAPPRQSARPPSSPRNPALPNLPPLGAMTPPRPTSDRPQAGSATAASPPTARYPDDLSSPPSAGTVTKPHDMPPAVEDDHDHDHDHEEEDEATKVHAPNADILRTLALQDVVAATNARAAAMAAAARQKAGAAGPPPPMELPSSAVDDVAGLEAAARDAAMKPPAHPHGDAQGRPAPVTPVPPSMGTLMMAPAAHMPMPRGPGAPQPAAQQPPAPQQHGSSPHQGGGLGATMAMAPPVAMPKLATPGLGFTPPPPAYGTDPMQAVAAVQQQTEPMQMQHMQSMQPQTSQQPSQQQQQGMGQLPYGQGSQIVPPVHSQAPGAQPQFGAPPFGQRPPDQPFPPSSYAQAQPEQPAAAKPLPVVPIAIGLGVLAVGGIILGVLALHGRRAKDPTTPTGSSEVAADSSGLTPVPVPVPVPEETATVPPAAVEIDATPAPAAEEDAATTAVAPSAAPSTTAAPTAATSAPVFTWPPPSGAVAPPTAVAVPPSAKPTADPNAFNEGAARARLAQANGVLIICKKEGGVTGSGNATVTFGPEGNVTGVAVDPPFGGTPAGDCVSAQFRRAKVSSFTGSPQTVRHAFEVPK